MNHVDLFSGIGGFALAATWVWGEEYHNLGHSEIEKFPCKVYHKHFPESECLGDITKIDWARFKGRVDILTGGFPCQPHSVAGKQKGSRDERDLWGECVRALRDIRPRYALFENVPGLLTSERGEFFNRVLSDIHKSGYDAEWQIISAADVGAEHLRERLWILAYPTCERWDAFQVVNCGEMPKSGFWGEQPRGLCDYSLNANGERIDWTISQPRVDDMVNGLSQRLAGHKHAGNSIVPQCAEVIMRAIKDIASPSPSEKGTR